MWRKYRVRKCAVKKIAYNNASKRCQQLLDRHALVKESNILRSGDLGQLYRFVNSKLSSKSGVGPLRCDNGEYVFSDITKANMLNNYFVGNCCIDNGIIPNFNLILTANSNSPSIDKIEFSVNEVYTYLKKLKNTCSSGPDKLPPIFFKYLASVLAGPITELYINIFSSGSLPVIWKTAIVTPIFKKGSSSSVANYRPISLTCVLRKGFEYVIKNQLVSYLQFNGMLDNFQHGFISNHSVSTNLLESLNDWTLNLKRGGTTRVAFIDFSRAFDSVSHAKLVYKLGKYGVNGILLNIIENFLLNRSQVVSVNGCWSNVENVFSGVPQGSVLGPLLFIIYINDLASIFTNSVTSKCFADDAKLYTEITCEADNDLFQASLDLLIKWSRDWQLNISFSKCASLDIYTRKNKQDDTEIFLDGHLLKKCDEFIDLGVKLDHKLNFTSHITQMVSKAKQRMFLIFRCFLTRDISVLLLAFKSYILPLLNYCSSVWSPYMLGDIKAIESVQRLFTRKLPGLQSIAYSERLASLNLPSLELRRLRSDLQLCFKILHREIPGPPNKFGLVLCTNNTRGHSLKLYIEDSKIDVRKHFFSNRIARPWNSLPKEAVEASSPDVFKRFVLHCDLNKFLINVL